MRMKNQLEVIPKFFNIHELAPWIKNKKLRYLSSWIEYIIGLSWFHQKTEVLRKRYSHNLIEAMLELFPCLNIGHSIFIDQKNPFLEPGGKIIVANHEGFFLDSIFLTWLVGKCRDDIKYIATSHLSFKLLLKHCFFLDIRLNKKKDAGRNIALYQEIVNWLKEGKIVIVFPEMHHETKKNWRWEKKLPWSSLPSSLAKAARVPIIPIKLTVPQPCLFRILTRSMLFFYNIKMRRMARLCFILCGVFSCRQVKFSSGKRVSCVVGPQLMPNMSETQGNYLRDYVFHL